jgi:hypothetical protein
MTRRLALLTRREHTTQKVGDLLARAKFAPCGPVVGHDRIKHCTSLPDLIGRHLLIEYSNRQELAYVRSVTLWRSSIQGSER